jgi:hypothetical protein
VNLPEAPIGELNSFDDQVRLLFDLIALAYRCRSLPAVRFGSKRPSCTRGCRLAPAPAAMKQNAKNALFLVFVGATVR